jgi:hypothetical protein
MDEYDNSTLSFLRRERDFCHKTTPLHGGKTTQRSPCAGDSSSPMLTVQTRHTESYTSGQCDLSYALTPLPHDTPGPMPGVPEVAGY